MFHVKHFKDFLEINKKIYKISKKYVSRETFVVYYLYVKKKGDNKWEEL